VTETADTRARRALPAAFDAPVLTSGTTNRTYRKLRIITGASKRSEPLREGRLWRSRRSGRRGRVGGVGSTLMAAPGCPALTT